jgi:hypothetical protein
MPRRKNKRSLPETCNQLPFGRNHYNTTHNLQSCMKRIPRCLTILALGLLLSAAGLRAQTVIGGSAADPSARLDVQSTTKGMLTARMTGAQRNAIVNPATGLVLYNTDLNCLQINIGTPAVPYWICLEERLEPSTNGSGVVFAYGGPSCVGDGAIRNDLIAGQVVQGVYMILYAEVAQLGTWSLSATADGVTFSGSGAFTTLGCQPIVLTGNGIPAEPGTFTWTTNSTPSGSASSTVETGKIDTLLCASARKIGSLVSGVAASGVSARVPYAGGNSGAHNGQTVSSTGVTGLTATLIPGNFANGADSLTYSITGMPSDTGTASFALNIGGKNCTLTFPVESGTITALNCASAVGNGSLVSGVAASGVSSRIPYTGGNGGPHYGQTVSSTGVTGLTATLTAGSFAIGADSLTYTITGTPSGTGTASFALNIGGRNCTLTRSVTGGIIDLLNCASARNIGSLVSGVAASGVSSRVPYTGGNGGVHNGQTVTSTGVTGLTATLTAGTFVNGADSLTYTITGTPSGTGTASFALNIGGATCTLTRTVASGAIDSLYCASARNIGSLVSGVTASGVSVRVPYTGGNGGPHNGQTVTSTGVTGLTATLTAGTFAIGADSLTYTITGTPSGAGTAAFALNIGGKTCTLTRTVSSGAIDSLYCASARNIGSLVGGASVSGVSVRVPYTGGNGGPHNGQTVTSTGVTGLTATLAAGTFAIGADSLTYTITGTPSGAGTASFALSIGGRSCTLTRTVSSVGLNCASATNSGSLVHGVAASGVSISVPYTGGNGGSYGVQTVMSTDVTGLTATLSAGNLAVGAGSFTYNITGTPGGAGTASFSTIFGGQNCTLTFPVDSGRITTLNCTSARNIGNLIAGVGASGISSRVPYTGGNGGVHNGQTVTSTGVTGLTATLTAGNFAVGADSLTYTITGTPSASGTASFALNIGGQSCTLTRTVLPNQPTLLCSSAGSAGTPVSGVPVSGVSLSLPYSGGNGNAFTAETVSSTGVTGLTATRSAGNLAVGSGSLNYTVSGTPNSSGTASFVLTLSSQSCTLTLAVETGKISNLNCASATNSGSLVHGVAASGVSSSVPYTGGNGGPHSGQTVTSTGVTGLTATTAAGAFLVGAGALTYTIGGTPSGAGTASFALNIGGQNCTLTFPVDSGRITTLNCASARNIGNLIAGVGASGISSRVPYTGGNGGVHSGQTVTSTGVTGLTATTAAGSFAVGADSLTYSITGTPSGAGTASFALNIGGRNCTLTLPVDSARITTLNCASATNNGALVQGVAATGVNSSVPYTGGNGGFQSGQTVTSTGVIGLTATLSAGSFAVGAGALSYSISGTPQSADTAYFALNIGGQTCTLKRKVDTGRITTLNCASARNIGNLSVGVAASGVSARVPYTGGNGGPHSGQTVTSTGVTGLTATLTAGTFAVGADSLTYTITGTPSGAGTVSFALNIGGQTCTLTRTISSIELNCASTTHNGVLTTGIAASGVSSSVPYTGGNGETHSGQTVTSTGVTGLTATLPAGSFATGAGTFVYNITGTPSSGGTATFALNIGGQTCNLTRMVEYVAGTGALNGRTCFDIALSNDNTNNCAALANRIAQQADFTLPAIHTQTYTFTPSATVSNVRFAFMNLNGQVITAVSGGNSGNNITSAVTATVNYNTNLNTLALGRTNSNPLRAEIYVIYNDGATNNGTNRQIKLTVNVKDCVCCGAFVAAGDWRAFMCHNLGAVETADPFTPSWQLNGNYYQWGRNPTCFGRDGTDAANTCSSPVFGAAAPWGNTTANDNAGAISGWALNIYASTNDWLDSIKTANDPCPAGFRVFTNAQAQGLAIPQNNTWSIVGSWTAGSTNYTSGRFFGSLLFLPAAGSTPDGQLSGRGGVGNYWTSSFGGSSGQGRALYFTESIVDNFSGVNGDRGYSVRCIADKPGGAITLNCAGATFSSLPVVGLAASGITAFVPYSGGNGGFYSGQTVTSTGVTGLTATLAPGNYVSGSASLSYAITGTPADTGIANFVISPSCTLSVQVETGKITTLDCASASHTGTLNPGVAASGVSSSVPYTGGNGGPHNGQTVSSTGVTGLTATLAAGNFVVGPGALTYTITGTPSGTGTASFALNIGGQSCTITCQVNNLLLPPGSGTFSGRICFDIALSNNNTNNCGALSSRTPRQANFTQAATHTQTYTFTPSGTVSNVRFAYLNTNEQVIIGISGGNGGNNISTSVTATVNYNTNLNTLALGRTNSNPLTADIYAIYNDGPTNNGADRRVTISVQVKDCACCGAFVAAGVWKDYMCHNLGADQNAAAFTPSWQIIGNYYQWGRKPTCFGRDGIDGANPCSSPVYAAAGPWGSTTANDNAGTIAGWGTTAPNNSWLDNVKADNDPCPAGFRVPNNTHLTALENLSINPNTTVGTWTNISTNYSSGKRIGTLLFLPAGGLRQLDGTLQSRGSWGYYWSTTFGGNPFARILLFNVNVVNINAGYDRVRGLSVRCIAE